MGLLALSALWLAACSKNAERVGGASAQSMLDGAVAGSAGNSGTAGDFGNAGANAGTSGSTGGMAGSSAGLGGGPAACLGDTQHAEPVGVDMFVMLDRSSSMLGVTGSGDTKWDAIRTALTAFAQDPDSAGLGVGLQYFPLGIAGVPETCSTDAECDSTGGGVCMNRACEPPLIGPTIPFTVCLSDLDCPVLSGGCIPFGICSLDESFACFDIGANGCDAEGDCVPATGECSDFASCDPVDYSAPDVEIAELPGNAQPFIDSLMNAHTSGLTPTSPAIAGAIDHATTQASGNPDRRSIVVLATDGLPTVCAPAGVTTVGEAVQAVANTAARGVQNNPSIRTYVIGVFAPEETDAQTNLDLMADAGGTGRAFIVDSSADVAMQLLDALAEIRAGSLKCELQVPEPPMNQTLAFDRVNIELKSGSDVKTLLYVTNEAGCAGVELGWFYDVDPATGATPTTIRICDNACDDVQAEGSEATLEVRLGCATIRPD